MTCYFGCAYDIFPKFGTNTSNRKILNVTKFCSRMGYEKKLCQKNQHRGGGGGTM